mmetsp:Transcript_31326/g.99939  ORF Transcript_31326/g.99939 Transcript_31326/m.99939 type:complete len:481 (-) Transcript_31326:438-1880(-)
MARHVEAHHALQEHLARLVEGKERVAVDVVELALARVREPLRELGHVLRSVQAEQLVEPPLALVARGVADGLAQDHLLELPRGPRQARPAPGRARPRAGELGALLAQLLDELQREGAPGALVAVDGGAEEHEVRPQQLLHHGQGDRRGFVDHQQLGLRQLLVVLRLDVLHRLPVPAEHVDAHHSLAERGVGGLHEVVVEMLLVPQRVQALEDKLEERAQVLRGGRGHEDVGVPQGKGSRDGHPKCRRLPAPAPRRQRHGRAQGLLRRGVEECDHRLGLVEGPAELHQGAHRLGLAQGLGKLPQLRLLGALLALLPGRDGRDALDVAREGEDVQLVVHDHAVGVGRQRECEALVEPRRHVLVGLGAEARVHVHGHLVEPLQRLHVAQQHHDHAAALHGLNGAREEIRGDGLKVLEHAHAVRVAQDLVCLAVISVPDVGGGDEERERILVLGVEEPPLHHLLNLVHPLLAVARQVQVGLIAP